MPEITENDLAVDQAVKQAIKEDKTIVESEEALVMRVHQQFIANKVAEFPKLCQHTYRINKQNDKFLEDYGNKGKYTDTFGWSKDHSMKNKWVVPTKLKHFMERLVYNRFWEEDNQVVRDSFMTQICKGGTLFDYEQLLKKVVLYYGTDLKNTLGSRASGSASIQ